MTAALNVKRLTAALAWFAFAACGGDRGVAPRAAGSTLAQPEVVRPCERARASYERLPKLVEEGKLDRAVRVIHAASALCPEEARRGRATELDMLAGLHRWGEARALTATIDGLADATPEERAASANAKEKAAALDVWFEDTDVAKAAMREVYKQAAEKDDADPEAAYALYLKAWELWRPNGQALAQAGLAASKLGRPADAQRLFDQAIVELEAAAKKPLALDTPNGLEAPVARVAWSARGRIATASGRAVTVFAQATLREVARLEGPTTVVTEIAFSPDGTTLAAGTIGGSLWMWSLASAAELRHVDGLPGDVTALAFSADGKRLAVGTTSGAIELHPIDGDVPTKLEGVTGGVVALATSSDGKQIVAASSDRRVHAWDVTTGASLHTTDLSKLGAPVAISPDGRIVLTAEASGQLRAIDALSGKELGRLKVELPLVVSGEIDGRKLAGTVAFTADGARLVLCEQLSMRSWDLATRRSKQAFGAACSHLAISPDGATVAVVGRDDLFIRDSTQLSVIRGVAPHVEPTKFLAFGPDAGGAPQPPQLPSQLPLLLQGASRVWAWDAAADSVRIVLRDPATAGALTEDGTRIVTVAEANVTVTDAFSNRRVLAFQVPDTAGTTSLALPTNRRVVIGDHDGVIHSLALAHGAEVCRSSGHTARVLSLAVTRDQMSVGSVSQDNTVRTWNAATCLETARLPFDPHGVPYERFASAGLAFSGDGRALAFGASDDELRIWSLGTSDAARSLVGHGAPVESVAFLTNDRIASAAADGSVRLWDAATGAAALTLEGAARSPAKLAVTRDGRWLASRTNDGVALWSADGARVATLRVVDGEDIEAAYVFTPDGFIEFLGAHPDVARAAPLCRVGAVALPFAVCRERFEVRDLLGRVMRGDASYREP